jgi:hypothetical protein
VPPGIIAAIITTIITTTSVTGSRAGGRGKEAAVPDVGRLFSI